MSVEIPLGEQIIQEFDQLKRARAVNENRWQLIGEYVHGTQQNFTTQNPAGERLNEDRYSSQAVFANKSLSSALLGTLWPDGARSMKVERSDEVTDNQTNKDYFEKATKVLARAMDDPQARLTVVLNEYMQDQTAFGNSGVAAFEGEDSDLRFETWGIMDTLIDEGASGRVDLLYRQSHWTLRRVVATYGLDKVSSHLRDKYSSVANRGEKIWIIHAIKPRENRDKSKKNRQNMPYMSVHIEKETKHVLRESGFEENPVLFARFSKLSYEVYGRGPGDDSLSDILEQDYLTERFTVNVDKSGDPPLMVSNDGIFGGGVIDMSARAINVVDTSAYRQGGSVGDLVQPLFTVGELNTTLTRIDMLTQNISQHFSLDKLLDFNNQTQMTLGEAEIREGIRATALNSLFTIQISDLFDRLIARCFNVLLAKGKLGVKEGSLEHQRMLEEGEEPLIMPDEIADKIEKGKDIYRIKYLTPAARMMQAQKRVALLGHLRSLQEAAQTNPEVLDNFDFDKFSEMMSQSFGVEELQLATKEVNKLRQARNAAQAQQNQAEQAQQASETAKNLAESGIIQ